MMRIGKNKGSLATQRDQLVGDLRNSAESEKDARGNVVYWKASTPFFAETHAPAFVACVNSSTIASRIANFWTLPVTVDGKLSTNRMWRGIL
jgi:hypothetical protein